MTLQIIFSGYKTWGKEVELPLMSALVGLGFVLQSLHTTHRTLNGSPHLTHQWRVELNVLSAFSPASHTFPTFPVARGSVVKRQRIQPPTFSSVWFKRSGTRHLHKLFKARAAFSSSLFRTLFSRKPCGESVKNALNWQRLWVKPENNSCSSREVEEAYSALSTRAP